MGAGGGLSRACTISLGRRLIIGFGDGEGAGAVADGGGRGLDAHGFFDDGGGVWEAVDEVGLGADLVCGTRSGLRLRGDRAGNLV